MVKSVLAEAEEARKETWFLVTAGGQFVWEATGVKRLVQSVTAVLVKRRFFVKKENNEWSFLILFSWMWIVTFRKSLLTKIRFVDFEWFVS